jgi:hypothetical protein
MDADDAEFDRLDAIERATCARFLTVQSDFPGGSPVVDAAEERWRKAQDAVLGAEALALAGRREPRPATQALRPRTIRQAAAVGGPRPWDAIARRAALRSLAD